MNKRTLVKDKATYGRTQRERSDATIAKLMRATLNVLARLGYANLSVVQVSREAGLSRGAIFHHFTTKRELAAAAMRAFYAARYEQLMDELRNPVRNGATIDQRLDIFRHVLSRDIDISLQIFTATRSDPELRALVHNPQEPQFEEQLSGYLNIFPEAGSSEQRYLLVATLGAFLRGLGIQELSDPARVDSMFEMMRTMVHLYLARDQAGAPQE